MPLRLSATRPPEGGLSRSWGRSRQRGFTLVELVLVMILVAALAAVGAGRFADRDPFVVQGVADQLVSGLRLAQASALAQRRSVHVVLAASPASLRVCLDAACTQPLSTPAGDGTWLADATELRLSTAASFAFGPDGTPTLATALGVRVLNADGSAASRLVTVEAGSGHLRQSP